MASRLRLGAPSLVLTAVVAAVLGAAGALRMPSAPTVAPRVTASLALPGSVREGESVDLVLMVGNAGPGSAQAPLDGVLSLEIVDLGDASEDAAPTYVASSDVFATPSGPLVLAAGMATSSIVQLASIPPLDRAGTYLLRGELYGPAGVLPIEPIVVEILPEGESGPGTPEDVGLGG